MCRRNLLILFCLVIGSLTVPAQEYSYARYDVKDGLAGSVVYHGVEDKDGYLWFATETGVSRFDGTHFRNFTKADGLPDNEILKLFVDSKNRIWMLPFRNSICYYWKGKIYNQENDPQLKKVVINERISTILEDRQGNLLLKDYSALYFINADGNMKVVREVGGKRFAAGYAFLTAIGHFSIQVQLAKIEYPGPTFIVEYDPKGAIIRQKLFPYAPWGDNFAIGTPHMEINRLRDSLIATTTTSQHKKAIVLPPAFNSLSLINDTICSINTGNGALFYDARAGKVVRHVLPGKNVNSVFQDKEGNSWLLTAGAGIFRVGSFEFTNFTFTENKIDYLGVFSIAQFDSTLYVGTEKSLLYAINPGKRTILTHHVSNYSINNKISAIVQLSSGRIMLGTNEGIIEFKGKGERSKVPFTIKSIQVDGNRLLASTQIGVVLLSEKMLHDNIMIGKRSACSYVQNKIYYNGTLNGLYTIDSTGRTTWLGEQEPLLSSRISDIEGSAEGTIWIATHGEGLVGYKDGRIIWSIRQKDGLTSDICRNVFIAGNEVWVGTDKGLNKVVWDQGRYHITTFTSADGLMADIINAVYVDGSRVYAGTPAGLTTFDANKISLNSFCKLRMTGIQAVGRQWAKDTTAFSLQPNDNAIRFDYVGISYRSAGDITYRYRLLGLNDTWQTTRETFLSYPSLPSGDYVLQVKATNKFGVESDMVHIPFRVEKLLWEKNWFRALVLVLAAGAIWLFVDRRIKKLRKQNDEKMQISNRMAELEQMALKAQMNPHFIFNSLNSVQQYVIDKDLLGANKFITEFSRLIRLTLDISSRTKISLYEEISYLATYLELEKTKFEDKFSYSIVVSPDIDTSDWSIPPMILQPYVENSIRHGVRYRHDKLGHIKVSFLLDGQYLICQVEDNGVGRKKAGQYKSEMPIEYQSKGMSLTAKRIEMLNKNNAAPVLIDIEDLGQDNMATGTRVILRFPLDDASRSS